MDIRKCAPVYVSGILTAIAFIALVFIPVGGVSILEALIFATELTTAGFVCFGLFAIAHMVVVAAAAICCAAIAVSGMRKRKSAEDLARRTVNAIAVIVLLIGMLSVAQTSIVSFIASGYGSETMAFTFYPSVWVCFGIGMSALLVCFICGMSACPPGLPLNDVPRRLFSVFLAVIAFVLACALNNIIHINNTIVEIAAMAFRVLLLSGTFFWLVTCVRVLAVSAFSPKRGAAAGEDGRYPYVRIDRRRDCTLAVIYTCAIAVQAPLAGAFTGAPAVLSYGIFSIIVTVLYLVFFVGCGIAHKISTLESSRITANKVLGTGSAVFFIMLDIGCFIWGVSDSSFAFVAPTASAAALTTLSLLVVSLYDHKYGAHSASSGTDESGVPAASLRAAAYMPAEDPVMIDRYFPAYYALRRIDESPFTPQNAFVRPSFTDMCADLRAYSAMYGIPVTMRTAMNVIAGIAASEMVCVTGDPAAADSVVRALGAMLGGGFGTETVTDADDRDVLLGRRTERGYTASAFISSLYSALKNKDELRAVTVCGVKDENALSLLPQATGYACDPVHAKELRVCANKAADPLVLVDDGCLHMTRNVRFASATLPDGVISPAALSGAAIAEAMPDPGYMPDIQPAELHINMTDYGGMMDDALDKYYLTEAEWRCIDRLENCLEKLGLRSDNVRTRRMERFISVYMACGGSAEDAADSALVSLVLPRLVLTDRQALAEAHLPETLNSAFGQDAIPQSRGFLRRAGLI